MSSLMIFKREGSLPPVREAIVDDLEVWTPSFSRLLPPGKSFRYIIYWVFHYLRIFRNRNYEFLRLRNGGKPVASLLVVPAYFKWPFMGRDDVQFTYVMTASDSRGKGFATVLLQKAVARHAKVNYNLWYVTDESNTASIKLCQSSAFTLYSYGQKTKALNRIRLIS